MKKIIIIMLAVLSIRPVTVQAQFGADAAALMGFLAPYLGTLQTISQTTGLEIADIKAITEESIRITSNLAKVYNAGARLKRTSERTVDIYAEYLKAIVFIYENNIYFDENTTLYHVAVLNKTVFGQTDTTGKFSIDNVLDGTLGELGDLLNNMEQGAQASLTEMATYLDKTQTQMNQTLSCVRSYKSYLQCIVSRQQHQLGMYEIDEYLRNTKQ